MKRAAIINDLSSFGKCSLTASIPVLSVLGIQACPLPTAVLTAQTGYEHYHMYSFADKFDAYMEDWIRMGVKFDGIYSGFLPDCSLQKEICRFYQKFAHEQTVFLLDPVMGDNGRVFGIYSEELLDGMLQMLKLADIATPNLTEACLLADVSYEKFQACEEKQDYIKISQEVGEKICRIGKLGLSTVISGIKFTEKETGKITMGNMAVCEDKTVYVETEYLGGNYSGTGDLFASCLLGYRILGVEIDKALKYTVDFIMESIKEAEREQTAGKEGIGFEKHLPMLWEKIYQK